jgi:predicted DNA-binding transcriptional regulator AlpA
MSELNCSLVLDSREGVSEFPKREELSLFTWKMSKKNKIPDDLIRVSTAAKIKGLDRQTIYYHIENNNLKTTVIDGTIFVSRSDVEQLPRRFLAGSKNKKIE